MAGVSARRNRPGPSEWICRVDPITDAGKPGPVDALFFDLDGTLLDGSSNRAALLRTCAALAAAQPGLDPGRLWEANSTIWRAYWREVENEWMLGALDGAAVSLEAWRRTLHACGYADDALARLARDLHRQYADETMRLFDDVPGLLAALAAARLPLALITNGASDTQRNALRVVGLERHFGAVVVSGEAGAAKPDAVVFGLALDKLGVQPERVWHIGDNLLTDVAGAKAAGITAVWLNRSGAALPDGPPQPDYEVRSLRELAALLALGE